VSLVAILDADKEGFLRSENSLIQTIGRAARHLHGRAILYADRITGSIERALAETERRRTKQIAFNLEYGITPRGIQKSVADIMEGARSTSKASNKTGKHDKWLKVAEPAADYHTLSPQEAIKRIKKLEQQMFQHARNLEFEDAARLRDEIDVLRKIELGLSV
jgi:excinuclease ABC subunit B